VSYCQEYLSISVTQTTICKCLAKLGINWNRGKLTVTSPDPLYSVKRARVSKLKEKALLGNLSTYENNSLKHPTIKIDGCTCNIITFD
jgi:hypothetical protein